MSERRYVRSFAALQALHYLPLGLLVPVEILIMQARGLTAAQIGAVIAVIGLTTALLELPTGGLADVVGRRLVLVVGALVTLSSLLLLAFAGTFAVFVVSALLFSVGKALESGPLESWFVDAVNDLHEPGTVRDTVLTRGLSRGETAVGLSLAVGAVAGGGLAELSRRAGVPASGDAVVVALSVPLLLAAALVVAQVVALLVLMDPHPHPRQGLGQVARGVPSAVADAARLVVGDAVLRWFGLRWLLIPAGFLAFELVTPIRLSDLLSDPATAAAVLGPLVAICFIASAVGATVAPWIRRRVGPLLGAGLATAAAGLAFTVAGLGGVVGLAVALVAAHLIIGPVNALNGPFLHARVPSSRRATMLSFESVVANLSVAAGALVLGGVTGSLGTAAAFGLAGLLTGLAALPLLGVAMVLRRERGNTNSTVAEATHSSTDVWLPGHADSEPPQLARGHRAAPGPPDDVRLSIELRVGFPIDDEALSELHRCAFDGLPGVRAAPVPWAERLQRHSLTWVGAFDADDLVGFVHLCWDGGSHAFVLDTMVHPEHQRRGIGRSLLRAAAAEGERAGCHWLHVDYEPHLQAFYRESCGFRPTEAGLLRLTR